MTNKAYDGAHRKGRSARDRGIPETESPYGDHRTWAGGVTFSRAFLRAWLAGWRERDQELTSSPGTEACHHPRTGKPAP